MRHTWPKTAEVVGRVALADGVGWGAEFATKAKGFGVAQAENGETFGGDGLSASNGTCQRTAAEVTFGRAGKVTVPDIPEGVVEADAFEAVVEADRPAMPAGEGGEGLLGEGFEVGDGHGQAVGAVPDTERS